MEPSGAKWSQVDPGSLSLNSKQYQQSSSPIIEPFFCAAIASIGLRELVLLQTISIFEESVSFDFENASEIFEIGKT